MHLIEFKICVVVGNGSRVVVTHQIFYCTDHIYQRKKKNNLDGLNGFNTIEEI